MNPWEKKKWLAVAALVLVCVGGSLYMAAPKPAGEPIAAEVSVKEEKTAKPQAVVYISGAVVRPGLYPVEAGIRFQEALEKAGGPTEDADLTKVNLAKKCKDGTQINVPFKKAAKKNQTGAAQKNSGKKETAPEKTAPAGEKINLNQAPAEALESLPGIGPALARRIVEHRQKQPFARVEDLQQVSGIGPAKFSRLRDLLEV